QPGAVRPQPKNPVVVLMDDHDATCRPRAQINGSRLAVHHVEQPAIGPDPDIAAGVFKKGIHGIAVQNATRVQQGELAILQQVYAAALRADPQGALAVFEDSPNRVVPQSLPRGIGADPALLDVVQASPGGAYPNVAIARLPHALDYVARKALPGRQSA